MLNTRTAGKPGLNRRASSVLLASFALSLSLSGLSAPAHAAGGSWFAIEGTSMTVSNGSEEDINPFGMRFRLGTRISETFDIEGHMGFTADDDTAQFENFSTGFTAGYLKAYLPIGYNSAFFAKGGFANVTLSQTIDGREFDTSRTGFSYGFGMETRLSERADLTADFVQYASEEEGAFEDISAVNFGLKIYF